MVGNRDQRAFCGDARKVASLDIDTNVHFRKNGFESKPFGRGAHAAIEISRLLDGNQFAGEGWKPGKVWWLAQNMLLAGARSIANHSIGDREFRHSRLLPGYFAPS